MKKICILDYGSGNVKSVFNLIDYLNFSVKISNKKSDINDASHIILPGVGSFGSSMKKIKENIEIDFIKDQILIKKKPFLGICVGMQVLATIGEEFGNYDGLDLISGRIVKLDSKKLPLPHIGWNNIEISKKSDLLIDLDESNDFYFVHSFHFQCEDEKYITAKTQYRNTFNSIVEKENIFGVQFHPEKSQKTGQIIFRNFLSIA